LNESSITGKKKVGGGARLGDQGENSRRRSAWKKKKGRGVVRQRKKKSKTPKWVKERGNKKRQGTGNQFQGGGKWIRGLIGPKNREGGNE